MWEMGIYAAIAPFGLLLLSSIWSYPAVLEEAVKWIIIGSRKSVVGSRVIDGALVGGVFGLSEAVLFSLNAWSGGQWESMGMRLLLTVPMHTLTAAVIAWGVSKRVGWVGLIVAMGIHAGFNYLVR